MSQIVLRIMHDVKPTKTTINNVSRTRKKIKLYIYGFCACNGNENFVTDKISLIYYGKKG